jgi:hypothetical protein
MKFRRFLREETAYMWENLKSKCCNVRLNEAPDS